MSGESRGRQPPDLGGTEGEGELTMNSLMNLNTASRQELTQLPRIGADTARRIIAARRIHRRFRSWADVARIRGITRQDLEAIRTRAWIGPTGEETGFPAWLRPPQKRPARAGVLRYLSAARRRRTSPRAA